MKKTLTRFLSMFLVLTMLLTAVPMVLADNGDGNVGGEIFDPSNPAVPTDGSVAVTVGASELTLTNGVATTTVTATAQAPTGYEVTSYAWTSATGNGSSVSFMSTSAGSYEVSVRVTCTKTAGADENLPATHILTGKTTINVKDETVELESVTIKGPKKVEIGETIQLTYDLDPADYEPEEVEWEAISDEIEISDDGEVTGLEECDGAIVRLTVDGKRDSYSIEVVEATTKVSVTQEIIVAVGKSAQIDVNIDPEDAGNDAKITYDSKKESIATVSSKGVVTGKKAGATIIEVEVEDVDDFDDATFEVEVIVTDEDLSCDIETTKASTGSSTKTVTLKPDYDGDEDDVTYKFTITDSRGTISVHETTGVVTAKGIAAARIKVQVLDDDNDVIAECYSGAAFYKENDVEAKMPEGNVTLAFNTNKDIEDSGNLVSMLVKDYTKVNSDRVYFTGLDSEEGSLSGSGWSSTGRYTNAQGLYGMNFNAGTKGTADFDFEIVMGAYEELPLVKGNIEIEYDADYSGIRYSGVYNQPLTFSEDDFEKYWDACDMDGDLEYIKITKLPSSSTEGTLYNSKTSTTATYKAATTQEFWVGSFTSSTTKKDLGTLTFRPLSTKKTEYTVLIPFTAYGDDDGDEEKVNGYIIIDMNEPANDITSRGVFFGTEYDTKEDLTYADQIAEAYEDAMGEDLGYVIFDLPKAEQAHLYSKIPSSGGNTLVAQGEHLVSNLKLWFDDNSSSTLDLEDAAIIPAAGFSGKIVLSYEAYDEDGKNEYEGTITFNVTKKTKSAVFSDVGTSYSWAADSTDFLNYEGIAQGSNGKYNPASNITRGDFMLMLYRAFLAEDYGTYSVTSNFPDVVKGTSTYSQETYQAVGVAKYLGIAQGSNGKYNPTASITREEAMTLIQRTMDKTKRDLDYETSTKATSFSDYSKISTWARSAIEELVSHGVIVGNNNKVNPQSNITRAEMACILHRVITY